MALAVQHLLLATLASGLIAGSHADLRFSRPHHVRNLLAYAPAPGPSASAKAPTTHFSYALGGQDWAGECGTGLEQSPINLITSGKNYSQLEQSMLPILDFGTGKNVVVINTGHAIQIQWETDKAPNASVTLGALVGKSNTTGPIEVAFGAGTVKGMGTDRVPVKPIQFHFHSPSEHTLNGKLSGTEAHLVTTIAATDVPACAPKGCIAVFGVLYDIADDDSKGSEFLAPLLKKIPDQTGLANGTKLPADYRLNLNDFFPAKLDLITYQGSLTTPPCTGNVLWTVFLETKSLSNRQMLKLQDTMGTQNEGEVHCNPVSEAVMLKLSADGNETSSPRPYTVCDGAGQRTNNRALQPRNGRNIGIFSSGVYSN